MRLLSLAFLAAASLALAADTPEFPARYLTYRKLPRVTEIQIDVESTVIAFCRDPRDDHGPHLKPGIHLYVSENAIAARRENGATRYPLGTLIVKEKFTAKGDATPDIITVMEKLASEGRVEDWRFTMIRLADRSLVREGFAISCTECHARYAATDYVTPVTNSLVTQLAHKERTRGRP